MPRKKKRPEDMDTNELVDHLFPPQVAEALRDAVAQKDTEEESTDDEPTS